MAFTFMLACTLLASCLIVAALGVGTHSTPSHELRKGWSNNRGHPLEPITPTASVQAPPHEMQLPPENSKPPIIQKDPSLPDLHTNYQSSDTGTSHDTANSTVCPPWFDPELVNGSIACTCGSELSGRIRCDQSARQAYLLASNCMSVVPTTHSTVVGACIYGTFHPSKYPSYYHKLPSSVTQLNNYTCRAFHRAGQLCGNCEDGYVLPLYSYKPECIKCSYTRWNWVKYFLVAYVPLTVLFVVVMCCRFGATSAQLHCFIFIAQGMSTPCNMRVTFTALKLSRDLPVIASVQVEMLAALYGIWNLDFLRSAPFAICLDIPPLLALSLDYAIAFYPLVLILVTYVLIKLYERDMRLVVWLWRPFRRCYIRLRRQWDIRTSIVEVFATFLILSYVKFLSVSFDILVPTQVFDVHGHSRLFLFNNASIEYFGNEHRPYAILAILVTLLFNILPLLLLLLYPLRSFQRCLTHCRLQSLALKTFMDAFLGHFKDGTNGTHDCRYFAGMYFLLQLVCHIIYASTLSGYYFIVSTLFLIGVAVAMIVLQPYRSHLCNVISIVLILSLTMLMYGETSLTVGGVTQNTKFVKFSIVLCSIVAVVPALYITGLVLHWLVVRRGVSRLCLLVFLSGCRRQANQDSSPQSLPDRVCNPQHYSPLQPAAAAGVNIDCMVPSLP